MSSPTVSVVIPTFNRAQCVREAIESVLSQSIRPDEIIVVDDGSTDHTADVLSEFGDTITVVRQPNRGVSEARNAGVRHAKGEWIAFLDSDDVWLRDRMAVLHRDIRNTDAGVHVANVGIVESTGHMRDHFELQGFTCASDRAERHETVCRKMTYYPCIIGVAVRREWIVATGGFDATMSFVEDLDLLYRLIFRGPWLVTSAIVAAVRRVSNPRDALAHLEVSDPVYAMSMQVRAFERLLSHPSLVKQDRQVVRRRLSGFRFNLARALTQNGQTAEARKNLLRSAREHPTVKGWLRAAPPLMLGKVGYRLVSRRSSGYRRSDSDAQYLAAVAENNS